MRPTGIMKKQPVFLPRQYRDEMYKVPKAMQSDILWNFALLMTGEDDPVKAMDIIRNEIKVIKTYQ